MGERSLTNVMIGLTASAPGRITPGQRYLGNVTSFRKDVEVWYLRQQLCNGQSSKCAAHCPSHFGCRAGGLCFKKLPTRSRLRCLATKPTAKTVLFGLRRLPELTACSTLDWGQSYGSVLPQSAVLRLTKSPTTSRSS